MIHALLRTSTLFVAATLMTLMVAAQAHAAPRRVVTLTPFTSNTAVAMGVKPVAIGQVLGGQDRIDRRLRGVRRLPLSHPNGPNLEQLASLRPQLVVSAPIWRKGSTGMKRLKIKVVESDPTSVAGVISQTLRMGRLLGRNRKARAVALRQRREIVAAQRGIRKRPRVLIVLGVGRSTTAMLKNSWGGDIVRYAGGRLITGNLTVRGGYARISDETVVRQNPDVIIVVPHGNPRSLPRIARYMRNKPGWRKTKAARRNRIYIASGNSLLQAFTDPGRTIRDVRRSFLKN
jgi:iron complex transport system substrate-binding protein